MKDRPVFWLFILILAYAGAALPVLLMFLLGGGNCGWLVNHEFIAEEIVRTLVGSLGLVRGTVDHGDLYPVRPPGGFPGDVETTDRSPRKRRCAYTLASPFPPQMRNQSDPTQEEIFCAFGEGARKGGRGRGAVATIFHVLRIESTRSTSE